MKINPRKARESLKDVELLRKIFVEQCDANTQHMKLKFSERFGSSKWNFGDVKFVQNFFKDFVLAVDHPNEEELMVVIEKNLTSVVPFAKRDRIYLQLESI